MNAVKGKSQGQSQSQAPDKLVVSKSERDRRIDQLKAKPMTSKSVDEKLEEMLLRQDRIERHLGIK